MSGSTVRASRANPTARRGRTSLCGAEDQESAAARHVPLLACSKDHFGPRYDPDPMDGHGVMTVVACAGDLAFGALAFARRSKSTLGLLLALLFLDAFSWNFASLAFELSGVSLWHSIDRAVSSVMPALALHVVVAFVGRSRSLRPLIVATYLGFGALALCVQNGAWLPALAVLGPTAMLFALV